MENRVGQSLGNYRLTRLIGQGGFGDVYLGEHLYLNTPVAVKVLQARLVGENLDQFRTEAQTIARLVHPHIVRILDFGVNDGIPFLVMDYAPHGTLRQLHPKGMRVSVDQVARYVSQLSSALQYAHDRKLIHRDIKPENMLLGNNNEVLLSDFGLVLIAQSTTSQATQEVAGTIPYMAPEQINGKPRLGSDQYALAIVVYEWLNGERPFTGSFVEIATQHLMTAPAPLFGRVPGVSKTLESVIFTALAKDPQQRFATIQAFATAFAQAASQSQPAVSPLAPASLDQTSPQTYAPPQHDESAVPTYVTPANSRPPLSPYVTVASDEMFQSTYLTPPREPSGQPSSAPPHTFSSGYNTQASDETSRPTYVVTPPLAPGDMSTLLKQPVQSASIAPQPQQIAGPTGFDLQPTHVLQDVQQGVPANAPTWSGPPSAPGFGLNPPQPPPPASSTRRKGRRLLTIIGLLLLVALLAGGAVLALPLLFGSTQKGGPGPGPGPAPAGTASVLIVPASQHLINTFTIQAITGTPAAAQRQVSARILSTTFPAQTQTVNATGSQQTPATRAAGSLLITCRASSSPLTIPAGTIFTGNDGVQVSTDSTVTITPPACNVSDPAHAVQSGTGGNIPAHDMNQPYSGYSIDNPAPFSGGQDAQTSTVVSQGDINGATNTLEANPPNAQPTLQGQLHPNEQMVGNPTCSPNATANHKAGDAASTVTVSVVYTCTGEAYDHDGALALASTLLTNQATTNPGAGFSLVGKIVTTLAQPAQLNSNTGTVTLKIHAEGIWAFTFTDAQKLQLANMITGKKPADAQTTLLAQKGVSSVTIQSSAGDGSTLPTDPQHITINVQSVSGL